MELNADLSAGFQANSIIVLNIKTVNIMDLAYRRGEKMTKIQLIDMTSVSNQNLKGRETVTALNLKEETADRDQTAVIYERNSTVQTAVYGVAGASARTSLYYQRLQADLASLGFYNGPINGDFSSSLSKKAVTNFQKVYGLSANGQLNTSTLDKLNEAEAMYRRVVRSDELKELASKYEMNLDSVEKQNLAKIWTFFRVGMGFTTEQAAGICGNLYAESKFSADNAQGNKNTGKYLKDHDSDYSFSVSDNIGYGLEQWTVESVKTTLKRTADNMGLSVSDLNAQLATIREEIESTRVKDWRAVLANSSHSKVSDVFLDKIERPEVKEYAKRRNYSKEIYVF